MLSNQEIRTVIDSKAINVVYSKSIPEREFLGLEEINAKKKMIVAPFSDEKKNVVSLSRFLTEKLE